MLKEKRQHSTELVPFTCYECMIPGYFTCVPLHWHGEFEINYILSGSAEFIYGDEHFISRPGDVIILPPNMLHAIYFNGGDAPRYDTLVFSADMLSCSANDRCTTTCIRPLTSGQMRIDAPVSASRQEDPELRRTVESIFDCARANTPHSDLLLKSELLRLFWLLEERGYISPREGGGTHAGEAVRPAIEYINRSFCEPITIDRLAETAHLSRSYFMEQFKRAAGVGAIEYINQLRIKKACRLLSDTSAGVAEIACDCGFRNLSNFNRQFRRAVSCTPGEYRRQVRRE